MSQIKEAESGTIPKSARVWSGSLGLINSSECLAANSTNMGGDLHARRNKSSLAGAKRKSDSFPFQEGDFEKTSGRLLGTNFGHHDPQLCVCDSCTCGRHLCSFKIVKPDLTKASIYNQSFAKKNPLPNKINIAQEYEKLQGPHIGMESRHRKEFQGRIGDTNQRRRPEDLLKVGGPLQQLTSYSSGFPGHKGSNQYVKPTDKCVRDNIPMRARSTYSNAFVSSSAPKPVREKIHDNLKSNNLWLGKSTYGNFFHQPNPEDYVYKVKNVEKLEVNPNYAKQYETTYNNSFLNQPSAGCPSKILLETKVKGMYSASKDRFSQNSDFKSLNPSFHAISTSKHFYV